MTGMEKNGKLLIELMQKTSPGAIQLARLVSLAARVEPELLRAMRLRHLPRVDAGAEADLWFSPLVQASSPLGLVLRPDVLAELRKDLAQKENRLLLKEAWETLQFVHESVSDAVRLEERVTYLSLSGASQETIDESLLPAVAALAKQNNEKAIRWARRVLPRLPEKARRTQAAKILDVKAAYKLGKPFLLGNHPPDVIQLVDWLAPGDMEQVPVGIRLLENRRGARWEFSHPPIENSYIIQAPKRDPIVIEIKSQARQVNRIETKRILLPLNDSVTVPHRGQEITIRTGLPKSYLIKPPPKADQQSDHSPATKGPGTDFLDVGESPMPGLTLRHVLRGHTGEIRRISWSPDGRYLASPSTDETIRIWDTRSGTSVRVLQGHTGEINSVEWSPDSQLFASASSDETVRLWDATSGRLTLTLEGHADSVNSVAWSSDGQLLASASDEGTIRVWDVPSGEPMLALKSHIDSVNSVTWSPNSQMLASASNDGTVRVWDGGGGQLLQTLAEHTDIVNSVAWSPDGQRLASCSDDKTIRIWESATGRAFQVLEGHSDSIYCVDFSTNGRWLATKGTDTIRLWRCDTGMCMAVLEELASDNFPSGLVFHPSLPLLATLGDEDKIIRIWELDEAVLLGRVQDRVHYTTAKILLVGDAGVGKTALGWRLAHRIYRQETATHGQQFWNLPQLGVKRADGTECEAVLWDLAGQSAYRQIHSTFLENVTVALLVFDPSNGPEPLRSVQFWLDQLKGKGRLPPTVLIGARIDRGMPAVSEQELEQFCKRYGISGGYVSTSARTGEGIGPLLETVKAQISWDELPATVTTVTFKRIKNHVLELKESLDRQGVLVSPVALREQLQTTDREWRFTDTEMMTAVGHLETHGYVTILRSSAGEQHILITPELLVALASSIVSLADKHPRELGAVSETDLLQGKHSFQELVGLSPDENQILLDATILRFLEHNICFRETLGDENLLVFPGLIKQKRPLQDDLPATDDISYVVRGRVEYLYASLVILLGNMSSFTRLNQWQNQAQYEMGKGEICGFRLIEDSEGEMEIVLYYSDGFPPHGRAQFQGLFEQFLYQRDVEVTRFSPVVCPKGHRQERAIVLQRVRELKPFMYCDECGEKITLPDFDMPPTIGIGASPWLQREEAAARLRSSYEVQLTKVKAYRREWAAPRCYISHITEQADEAKELIKDLREAGMFVVEQAAHVLTDDFIIVLDTPGYQNAFKSKAAALAADIPLINARFGKRELISLAFTGQFGPHEFKDCALGNFSDDTHYPVSLFDLVLNLYAIPLTHAGFAPLRQTLHTQWEQVRKKAGDTSPLKIFISYSHQDERFKDELVTMLAGLQRRGIVETWQHRIIEASGDWNQSIYEAMNNCDLALLLVSPGYLASRFIQEEEQPRLLQRLQEIQRRLIPIIVRPCRWQSELVLKDLQVLPKDGKPLITFSKAGGARDRVWTDLAMTIEQRAKSLGERAIK